MLLFSFHLVAIAILIAVVGSIGYQAGKKEGIRITKNHYESETEEITQLDGIPPGTQSMEN